MKIINVGEPKIIMSNPNSKHNYFGWPTAARLQNGKIAVVASGFRLAHICPFGKAVISYSEDEGETYTAPAPVIDTVLDDRDGGILPFGKSNVMVTSFNNSVDFQRGINGVSDYSLAYLNTVTPEEEEKALGATYRISEDYGVTFGEILKSPVTSPHGPVELLDGSLLWVGRKHTKTNADEGEIGAIQAYKINLDGTSEYVGKIEDVEMDGVRPFSCEPHAVVLDDGTILVQFRADCDPHNIFTLFQCESKDNGKTWTKPKQILSDCGGAPAYLFKHPSGMLISTYSYRGLPHGTGTFGIKAMFSKDNGKTWDVDNWIYKNEVSCDLGYPSTVFCDDGSLITIFYAKPADGEPAVIMQQKWRFEDEI